MGCCKVDDDEIDQLFRMGKKRKREEKSSAAADAEVVEEILATLEVAAEQGAELNRQSMPAVNKLKQLPLLRQFLIKKPLQPVFIDHGVLAVLKAWLEPLPDGSLPNIGVRTVVLAVLDDLPMGYERSEQLKISGLGKLIAFLSRSDEETPTNRKSAKALVDKWTRHMCHHETALLTAMVTPHPKVSNLLALKPPPLQFTEADLNLQCRVPPPVEALGTQRATRPEPNARHFIVRPPSRIDPDEVRARAAQAAIQNQRRINLDKKTE